MKKLLIVLLFLSIRFSAASQAAWQAPASANQMTNPLIGNKESAENGKKTFVKFCVMCHGEKGKGDGIAGMSLSTRPANLSSAKVQSQTDGAIFWKITNGKSPMPSFKSILTDVQREEVVCYIRELGKGMKK